MPNFFDYPQAISKELERMGYEVDCFDDRPSTNGVVKAIIRVNKDLIGKYISMYFEKMMEVIRTKIYDVVFFISGQSLSLSKDMIQEIKNVQPQAQYILYQWDSSINFPYIKRIEPMFDRCYSFERNEAQRNPDIRFLPLFYTRRYENMGSLNKDTYKYDFCFIGTAHPKKYMFIKLMSEQLQTIYPNQFIYYFFPSRIVYFYRKIMNPELRKAHYKEFHFESLSGLQLDEVYSNSRCILDSAQAGQCGLTIRVIEALGAKKKLITTNEDVKNYDFYCEENIYIYDGKKFDFTSPFFTQPYRDVKHNIYEKYSLRNWLLEMQI